ncbi:MAG: hypothetical protein WBK52_07020, partial [Bacilli bacterium]
VKLLDSLLVSIKLDDFVGRLMIRYDEDESKYNLVYTDTVSGAKATREITVAFSASDSEASGSE